MCKKIISLLVVVVMMYTLSACDNQKFELSATVDDSLTAEGIIAIFVETKNLGKSFSYKGSSTKIGADVEVFSVIDEHKYFLPSQPIAVNDDIGKVTIKKNEVIKNTLVFDNTGKYGIVCPAGVYSIRLSYKGIEKIYENAITLT